MLSSWSYAVLILVVIHTGRKLNILASTGGKTSWIFLSCCILTHGYRCPLWSHIVNSLQFSKEFHNNLLLKKTPSTEIKMFQIKFSSPKLAFHSVWYCVCRFWHGLHFCIWMLNSFLKNIGTWGLTRLTESFLWEQAWFWNVP